jgi:dTDP-4-amino-4,6-dideoxygalactose transaminase
MDKPVIQFIDLSAQRRRLGARIERAIARVLAHGRFILGPEVNELEERLQAFSGARHCITCANGTDALELALSAMQIGPGDAVIVPAFSFVATVEAVARVGATPVFADVDAETFNLCPESAETAIRAAKALGLSVRCVMPVDLFGQPADYDAIQGLAETHGLSVLADAAQSFGATWRGRRVGALAEVTTTSFYPAKPLGCYGDGGAIFTDDAALAAMLRALRCHGQVVPGGAFARIGRNSRLDTIQAAVLIEKLSAFEEEIASRNIAARRYAERLPAGVIAPKVAAGALSVWAQYTVKVLSDRDGVAASCRASGVPIAIHYATPLHRAPAYRHFPTAAPELKTADALSNAVLSLPMHADLDEATQERVIEAMRGAVGADAIKPLHAQA